MSSLDKNMENFEFQKYRDSLAQEIKQEPDKAKRREILERVKSTQEYQGAKKLRRQEFAIGQESKAQIEKLSQYAEEHYADYAVVDSEIIELLDTIGANCEEFENEILPQVSDELIDKVFCFIEGDRDEQIATLLRQANFDYESLLASEEDEQTKARALLEAVLKAQNYNEAVEQNKDKEIDFSGFEDDPDIPDAKEFVHQAFGGELLRKCLISKVKYAPDKVDVSINGADYMLPVNVYAEWEKQMPEVKSRKFRAESFVRWNTDPNFSKKFIPTPICFYSFYGEEPEKLDYLGHVPAEEKMRQYKLGAVAHEVAHHIYDYLMDADKRKEWKELVDRSGAVTEYAASYAKHKLKYDEFFAETVRLKTTARDYLKINLPDIDKFITDNFPDING